MAEFIEFLSKDALADLQRANAELVTMVSNVDKVGTKMKGIATPSGSDSAIKELTAQYKAQEKVITELQGKLQKLSEQKQKYNQKTQEEITNGRILASNANRQVLANSQLAGAYRNLSAQVSIASERVQNLIARGRTAEQTQRQFNRELRTAQREFQVLQTKVLQADKAVDKWNRTGERSIGFFKNLLGAFGVVGGVTLFAMISRDIFQTTKELQALDNALKLVTQTKTNFAQQQQFLTRIANDYGLEIKGLTKQFTQFYVSAKDKISGQEIQKIFESISKASASMGLSVDQQQRAFLALNQMMSKGTIQAEELRGQLGEALPGAFGIMAQAVGVTEKELQKMMKAGDLIASEVLPKFADQLQKTYSIENIQNIKTLTAEQNRLSNAWTDFVSSLDEDGNKLSKILMSLLGLMTETIIGWRELLTTAEQNRKDALEKVRVDSKNAIEEYYALNSDFNKKDLEEKKASYEEEARMIRRRLENLLNVNKVIKRDAVLSPFGQMNIEDTNRIKENQKEINLLNEKLSLYYGNIEGLNTVLTKKNKTVKTNTELTKEQIKAKADLIKKLREEYLERTKVDELESKGLQDGFLKKLRDQKRAFEEIQATVSDTSEEYQNYQKLIDGLDQSINLIVDPSKVIKSTGADEFMNIYGKSVATAKEETEELTRATEEFIESFNNSFLADAGLPAMDMFLRLEENGKSVFQNLLDGADTLQEKFQVTFLAISQVAEEAFAFIDRYGQENFDNQYRRLEQERDVALQFAGDSASAREEIENQYETRRAQIQRRQAEAEKQSAIFKAIINTAQAVVSALPNIPLSIAVGLIGAAQIGLIQNQQIPQFWTGTDNAPEGMAWTQEKGREIITDKQGRIKSMGSDKGAQMTYLSKGDKVFNASDTEALMFNSSLNNMLLGSGIMMPKVEVSMDTTVLGSKIDNLTNTIANKPSFTLVKDAKGERVYMRKQAEIKEMQNARLNIKTYDV